MATLYIEMYAQLQSRIVNMTPYDNLQMLKYCIKYKI